MNVIYGLFCSDCKHRFEFEPTPGQVRALKGGASVKIICPTCGERGYLHDKGLLKYREQEAKRNMLETGAEDGDLKKLLGFHDRREGMPPGRRI